MKNIARISQIKDIEKIAKNIKINIPSSKSYLNRALILSSIQKNKVILSNVFEICNDVKDMISCLKKIGLKIEINDKIDGSKDVIIYGNDGKFTKPKDGILNCGIGGTTTRFLLGLSSLFDFDVIITAEKKMLERPVGEVIDFLKQIGKKVEFLEKENCLPIKLTGKTKNIDKIKLDCSKSSQFLSSVLLVANELNIKQIDVKNLVSKSYINITLNVLKKFNINFTKTKQDNLIIYKNKTSKKINNLNKIQKIAIEKDCSSASYFLALQEIFNIKKNIIKIDKNSSQGDANFIKIIKKIRDFKHKKNKQTLILNMENMPDVSMTAMIICSLCDFKTKIKGLQTLPNKECDRLKAMHDEFEKIGVKTEISKKLDAITIYGNSKLKLKNIIEIETYNDHRIAMCFAILGAKIGNIDIKNLDVVSKSFVNFWDELNKFKCVKMI